MARAGMDHTQQAATLRFNIHVFSPNPSPSNLPAGNLPFSAPIQSVSVGYNFGLLVDNHDLFSWGYHGELHRLGQHVPDSHRTSTPARVFIPENPRIVQCAAGGNHSLVLDVQGNVFSFGSDDRWQLGRSNSSPLPTHVPLRHRVVEVRAGWNFSLAVPESRDSIITWGSGSDGQLLHGYFPQYSQPQEVRMPGNIEILSVGYSHVAAVLRNGLRRIVTWGNDGISFTKQHIIRDVQRISAEDIVALAAGKSYTLFLTRKGTVYSAGLSQHGQLGLGDCFGRSHACIISALLPYNIVQVAAANVFSCAFSDEGHLFIWGAGETIPRRVHTSGFGLLTRSPFSRMVRLEASAGAAAAVGVGPDQVDSCFSFARPMRAFILAVCNGRILSRIRNTKVYCRRMTNGGTNSYNENESSFTVYGPLLAAASPELRTLLSQSNGMSLDMSAYTRESAETVTTLLCCGFLDPSTSIATAQEVSGILSRFGATWCDRIVTEFLRRRLLQVSAGLVCDLWDTVDSGNERSDEIRMRRLLARVSSTNRVRIIADYEDGVSAVDFAIDVIVACAHSDAIRSHVSREIYGDQCDTISEWRAVLLGPAVSTAAVEALREWFRGLSLHLPQNSNSEGNIALCADVMRLADCLGMGLLKSVSERNLITLVDASLSFPTWKYLVEMTDSLRYFRARDKLLAIGDGICTSVHLKSEELRVQKMERTIAKYSFSQDVETVRSARRGLKTFRRSRVYCDSLMDLSLAIDNVKAGYIKDNRLHTDEDISLDRTRTPRRRRSGPWRPWGRRENLDPQALLPG